MNFYILIELLLAYLASYGLGLLRSFFYKYGIQFSF